MYFVTIRAASHLFGQVRCGQMMLRRCGQIATDCWLRIPEHFGHVRLDAFVVMPDHMHGILVFRDRQGSIDAIGRISAGSLGVVVRSYKSAVARQINALRGTPVHSIWQRNYFDRIIRDRAELNRVRRYIADNPARWNRTSKS